MNPFLAHLHRFGLQKQRDYFVQQLARLDTDLFHGQRADWENLLETLPKLQAERISLDSGTVTVGTPDSLTGEQHTLLKEVLLQFRPWRKGPFSLFGIHIETEWRSDWKWDRVSPHIAPLKNRRVLDIGCGSGYHCWRMLGAGAKVVLGLDPSQVYWFQFRLCKHFLSTKPVYYLPLAIENFPKHTQVFDTVFSMGVLYHRRSPFLHLEEIKGCLRKGGQMILETLIVEGPKHMALVPTDRYAQMRNVWFIPTIETMLLWLQRVGFANPRVVDITPTTTAEQKTTAWMTFNSLKDFLDPQDKTRTIEGYPAPIRAVFVAEK